MPRLAYTPPTLVRICASSDTLGKTIHSYIELISKTATDSVGIGPS